MKIYYWALMYTAYKMERKDTKRDEDIPNEKLANLGIC